MRNDSIGDVYHRIHNDFSRNRTLFSLDIIIVSCCLFIVRIVFCKRNGFKKASRLFTYYCSKPRSNVLAYN